MVPWLCENGEEEEEEKKEGEEAEEEMEEEATTKTEVVVAKEEATEAKKRIRRRRRGWRCGRESIHSSAMWAWAFNDVLWVGVNANISLSSFSSLAQQERAPR